MEADLAFRGVDLRDLYRPGSGLTPRRLLVLVRGLPPDAATWASMRAEDEVAKVPTVKQLRQRQAFYDSRGS